MVESRELGIRKKRGKYNKKKGSQEPKIRKKSARIALKP